MSGARYAVLAGAFLAVAVARLLSTVSVGTPDAVNPLRVGAIVALDYRGAREQWETGRILKDVYTDFFAQINWNNQTVAGRPVELVLADDGGGAPGGAAAAVGQLLDRGVSLILGPRRELVTEAAAAASVAGAVMVLPASPNGNLPSGIVSVHGPLGQVLRPTLEALDSVASATRIIEVMFVAEDTDIAQAECGNVEVLAQDLNITVHSRQTLPAGNMSSVADLFAEIAGEREIPAVTNASNDVSSGKSGRTFTIKESSWSREQAERMRNVSLVACVGASLCQPLVSTLWEQYIAPGAVAITGCAHDTAWLDELGGLGRFFINPSPWDPPNGWRPADVHEAVTGTPVDGHSWMGHDAYVPRATVAGAMAAAEALVAAIEAAGSDDPAAVMAVFDGLQVEFGSGSYSSPQGRRLGTFSFGSDGFATYGDDKAAPAALQLRAGDAQVVVVGPATRAEGGLFFPMPFWDDRPCFEMEPAFSPFAFHTSGRCQKCPNVPAYIPVFNEDANDLIMRRRECMQCELGRSLVEIDGHWVPDGRLYRRLYSVYAGLSPAASLAFPGLPKRQCQTDCEPGYQRSVQYQGPFMRHDCMLCTRGRFIDPNIIAALDQLCEHCSVGSFSRAPGETACRLCEAGRFSSTPGRSRCTRCEAGKAAVMPGSSRCNDCAEGRYLSQPGAPECELCPSGKSAQLPGSTECTSCERGRFSQMWQCGGCQPGRYNNEEGKSECMACPPHATCLNHSMVWYHNDRGYWAGGHWEGENLFVDMESCRFLPSACLARGECHEGHTGRQCLTCTKGYAMSSAGGRCFRCAEVGVIVCSLLLVLFLSILVTLLWTYTISSSSGRTQEVHPILIKQLLNHIITFSFVCRVANQMISEINADRASNLPSLISAFDWMDVTDNRMLSLGCLVEQIIERVAPSNINVEHRTLHWEFFTVDYMQSIRSRMQSIQLEREMSLMVFWTIIPFIVFFMSCAIGWVYLVLWLRGRKATFPEADMFYKDVRILGFNKAKEKKMASEWKRCLHEYDVKLLSIWRPLDHMTATMRGRLCDRVTFQHECYPLVVSVAYIFYPFVACGILRNLQCVRFEGDKEHHMFLANELKCYHSDSFQFMYAFAWASLWCVAIPVRSLLSLRYYVKNANPQIAIRKWGLWTIGYRKEKWWWEATVFVRKFLCVLIVMLDLRPDVRAFACIGVATFCSVLYFSVRPYDLRCFGLLGRAEVRQLGLWCCSCLGLELIAMQQAQAAFLFWIVIIILHCSYVFWICRMVLAHYFTSYAWEFRNGVGDAGWLQKRAINLLLARHKRSRKDSPYISVERNYGWVSICQTGGDETVSPHIPSGVDAVNFPNSLDGRIRFSSLRQVYRNFYELRDTRCPQSNRSVLVQGLPLSVKDSKDVKNFFKEHAARSSCKHREEVEVESAVIGWELLAVLRDRYQQADMNPADASKMREDMMELAETLAKEPWRATDLAFSEQPMDQLTGLVSGGSAIVVFKEKWMHRECLARWDSVLARIVYKERVGLKRGMALPKWKSGQKLSVSSTTSDWNSLMYADDDPSMKKNDGRKPKFPARETKRLVLNVIEDAWLTIMVSKEPIYCFKLSFLDFLARAAFSMSHSSEGDESQAKNADSLTDVDEELWIKATHRKDPVELLGDLGEVAQEQQALERGDNTVEEDDTHFYLAAAEAMEEDLHARYINDEKQLKAEKRQKQAEQADQNGLDLEDVINDEKQDALWEAELQHQHEDKLHELQEVRLKQVVSAMLYPNTFRRGMLVEDLQFSLMQLGEMPMSELLHWFDLFEERCGQEFTAAARSIRLSVWGSKTKKVGPGPDSDDEDEKRKTKNNKRMHDTTELADVRHAEELLAQSDKLLGTGTVAGNKTAVEHIESPGFQNWFKITMLLKRNHGLFSLAPMTDLAMALRAREGKVQDALEHLLECQNQRLQEERQHMRQANAELNKLCEETERQLVELGYDLESECTPQGTPAAVEVVPADAPGAAEPLAAEAERPLSGDGRRALSGPRFLPPR